MSPPRVVVTGVGLVSPLGAGAAASWKRLLVGGSGVVRLPKLAGLPVDIGGAVPRGAGADEFDADRCALAKPGDEGSLSPFIRFALAAADEALAAANWRPESAAQRQRTGVAVGSGIGGLDDIVQASDTLRERGARRVSPHFVPKMLVNMAAGQVSIRAGLQGPCSAPSTACATGAHAIGDALHILRAGAADVMLAGAAEASIEPLGIVGFSRLRALAGADGFGGEPAAASRPFDRRRAGFVMGEGAAMLVLETLDHARARGAEPLAEVRGVGLSLDAHHPTGPSENGEGALRAMRAALDAGGVGVDELDYVNAHATSTPAGDAAEAAAIAALVRGRAASEPPLLVSSTKGATGHLLGAAGAAEAVFTVLALRDGVAPPTLNLDDPDPPADGFEHVRAAAERPLRAALSNSFGFGGMNAAVAFSRVT